MYSFIYFQAILDIFIRLGLMSVGKISTLVCIAYYAKYEQHAANTGYISNLLKCARTLFVPFLGTSQKLLLQYL